MFQEKAMHYKEKKRSKTLVFLLTVDVCICICILLAAWAVFLKEPQAVALAPESESLEVEPNQTPIVEELATSEDESESSEGEEDKKSGTNLIFSDRAIVSTSDGKVKLNFGNGESSCMDITVRLIVQDQILAQSGKITPGNKVTQLDLIEGTAGLLSVGDCEGRFVVFFYDCDTGEKDSVVTNIPAKVTVHG